MVEEALAKIRTALTPPADIKLRVERYVADLERRGRPMIGGIGANETLSLVHDRNVADALSFSAWLAPEQLAAHLERDRGGGG